MKTYLVHLLSLQFFSTVSNVFNGHALERNLPIFFIYDHLQRTRALTSRSRSRIHLLIRRHHHCWWWSTKFRPVITGYRPSSREGSLLCHTFCDTWPRFFIKVLVDLGRFPFNRQNQYRQHCHCCRKGKAPRRLAILVT